MWYHFVWCEGAFFPTQPQRRKLTAVKILDCITDLLPTKADCTVLRRIVRVSMTSIIALPISLVGIALTDDIGEIQPVRDRGFSRVYGRKTEDSDDIESLYELAEEGDGKAQYKLGVAYDEGKGVAQNWVKASVWFFLSARSGYSKAKKRWRELEDEILSPAEISRVMREIVNRGYEITAEEVMESRHVHYEPSNESPPIPRRGAPTLAPQGNRAGKEASRPERNTANQSGGSQSNGEQTTSRGQPDLASIFGDIFEDFFNGGESRQARDSAVACDSAETRRIMLDLSLTFEEAALGCLRRVRVTLPKRCDVCEGTGAASGSRPVRCPQCEGRGESECLRLVSWNVPAGVDNGETLRMRLEGREILLRVHVSPHELFERRDGDLIVRIPVSCATAALGRDVLVPKLGGRRMAVRIPAGSQSGQVIRLRGEGIKRRGQKRGDMLCFISVEKPVNLNRE